LQPSAGGTLRGPAGVSESRDDLLTGGETRRGRSALDRRPWRFRLPRIRGGPAACAARTRKCIPSRSAPSIPLLIPARISGHGRGFTGNVQTFPWVPCISQPRGL